MGYRTLRQLSFQESDAARVPVGEPVLVEKGQPVPDFVKPFEISALTSAGVIVNMGDEAEDIGPLFDELPPALPNPEVPPTLAGNEVLPSFGIEGGDLAGLGGEAVAPEVIERVEGGDAPAGEKPNPRASKAEWESYAVAQGIPQGEAESMTKQELMTAVEGREQQ